METLKQIFDQANHIVSSVPPEVWNQAGQALITAVIASPLFLVLKKFLIKEREILMTIVTIVGAVSAGALVFVQFMPHDGVYAKYWALIAVIQGIVTYAATQPFWKIALKPFAYRVIPAIGAWWANQKAEAAKLHAHQTAEEPATGLHPLT